MTIEEAIEHFKILSDNAKENAISFERVFPGWKSNHWEDKELFDMAINALRAQQNPYTVELSVNDFEAIEADETMQQLDALKSENVELKHRYDSLSKSYQEKDSECSDAWNKIIELQKQIRFLSGQIEAYKYCAKNGG